MTKNCPGCGAPPATHDGTIDRFRHWSYKCESTEWAPEHCPPTRGGRCFEESEQCLRRQLSQAKAELEAQRNKTYRVCGQCGGLVWGTLEHPCDHCWSLGGELIEVAWAKLGATVDKLDKTADGVPVAGRMELWHIVYGAILPIHAYSGWTEGVPHYPVSKCYSTHKKAEEAMQAEAAKAQHAEPAGEGEKQP